jgi:methionyl aminopeptidase
MTIKTDSMRQAGAIINSIFNELVANLVPGKTTKELEAETSTLLTKYGAKSGTYGFRGFKNLICTSINEEIDGGVPSSRKLQEGDLLKLDLVISYIGFFVDKAITVGIPPLDFTKKYILTCGNECINSTIAFIDSYVKKQTITNYMIGSFVEGFCNSKRLKVIKSFGGHGIGFNMHSDPFIPNFGTKVDHIEESKLYPGSTFTIEPILVYQNTSLQRDGPTMIGDPLSCHFEETLLITETGVEVLTRL